MYEQLINKHCKIVHKDGERSEVSTGELIEFNSELKTLKIEKSSGRVVFINALAIDKLEVLE